MIVCSTHRYYSLIGLIVSTARTMYPGWRIRIYHNVTRENYEVLQFLHFDNRGKSQSRCGGNSAITSAQRTSLISVM